MEANRARLVPLFFTDVYPVNKHGLRIHDFPNARFKSAELGMADAVSPENYKQDRLTSIRDENTTYLQFNQDLVSKARRYYDNFANDNLPQGDVKRKTITNTSFEFITLFPLEYWFLVLKNEIYGTVMIFLIEDVFE